MVSFLVRGSAWRVSVRAALIAIALIAMQLGCPASAHVQDYPQKPVRLVVPFPPGGQVDSVARLVASKLSAVFGKQFFVDNRPGAGGNIGTELVKNAKPDGYTMLVVSASFASNPSSLPAASNYDPVHSFTPIQLLATAPNVLVVNPSLPVRSVKELIALAQSEPGKLAYASNGIGTPPHLAGELFTSMANLHLLHVPYKGGAAATLDLVAGRVPVMFMGIAPALPLIRAGKLRALATTESQRAKALPDVPTMAESGLKGFEVTNWIGLLAPRGTPEAVTSRIHKELLKAFKAGDSKEQFAGLGLDPAVLGGREFSEFIKADVKKWSAVATKIKAKND